MFGILKAYPVSYLSHQPVQRKYEMRVMNIRCRL